MNVAKKTSFVLGILAIGFIGLVSFGNIIGAIFSDENIATKFGLVIGYFIGSSIIALPFYGLIAWGGGLFDKSEEA